MNRIGKIVLAGGSGQIGAAICEYFSAKADRIIVLSRTLEKEQDNISYLKWNGRDPGAWCKELEDAEVIINLTGKNVNCRYTEMNKAEIFNSRTDSIEALASAIRNNNNKPRLWIQFASSTIYRHAEDRPMTEAEGEIGSGFSVEVCQKWEKTFNEQTANFQEMQKVVLRSSIVLSKLQGVFPRLKNLTQAGLGGKQGNGKQMVSWIHETDVVRIIARIINNPAMQGVYNCTAPLPLQNYELMRILRKSLGIPFGLPAPSWLLELGAIIIGTETELVLKSRWVLPERLLNEGFAFRFPDAASAIDQIVNN